MKRASFSCLCALIPFQMTVDYPRPPVGSRLLGENQTYTVQPGDGIRVRYLKKGIVLPQVVASWAE